jgi:hypothetical protein
MRVSVDVSRCYRDDVSLISNLWFTAIYFGAVFGVWNAYLQVVANKQYPRRPACQSRPRFGA